MKGVGEDFAGAGGAGDVGVAAGGKVAGEDFATGIDEDELGLGAAAVNADFIGGVHAKSRRRKEGLGVISGRKLNVEIGKAGSGAGSSGTRETGTEGELFRRGRTEGGCPVSVRFACVTELLITFAMSKSADEFAEAGAVGLGEGDVGVHAAGEVLAADEGERVVVVAEPFEDAEHEEVQERAADEG